MSILYDPRNVSHSHLELIYEFYVPNRRLQSSKLVICYFRQCPWYSSQKCGLSNVRKSHQPDICEDLQFKMNYFYLPFPSQSFLCSNANIEFISLAIMPALCRDKLHFVHIQIDKKFLPLNFLLTFNFIHKSSAWNSNNCFSTVFSIFASCALE